jgi:hypothetical protein
LGRPFGDYVVLFGVTFSDVFSATYRRLFGVEFNNVLAPLNGVFTQIILRLTLHVIVRFEGRLLHFTTLFNVRYGRRLFCNSSVDFTHFYST